MEDNFKKEQLDWPMFEHSHYQAESDGVPEVPADCRRGVFTELMRFVGWRYEESIKNRCLHTKCHYCLEEDFRILGLDAKWTGFVYEFYSGEKYSNFRAESIELNDKHAAEAAVELVNSFKNTLGELHELLPESTLMVYYTEDPFGYGGHCPETFIQTVREGFNSIGVKVMSVDEFYAQDKTRH